MEVEDEKEDVPVGSNELPGLVVEIFSVNSHIRLGVDLEPIAIAELVFPNLERKISDSVEAKTFANISSPVAV